MKYSTRVNVMSCFPPQEVNRSWFALTNSKRLGGATLSVDVVQGVLVPRSREAGVVDPAAVDGPLVLSGHEQLDLTPQAVQPGVVRERSEVCDPTDRLPVVPGPLQVHLLGVEVLQPTAEHQAPLHLGDLRDAGDLEERRLHCRGDSVVRGGGRIKLRT